MRTIEQAAERGIDPSLIRAIIRATGRDHLEDIMNHGADAGYPGLTYYSDTVAFFKRHRTEIVALVNQMAEELGETPAEMVAGFQCLAGRQVKRVAEYDANRHSIESANRHALGEYLPSVYRCLGGGRLTDEDTQVANALTWFAAEEVARAMCDE